MDDRRASGDRESTGSDRRPTEESASGSDRRPTEESVDNPDRSEVRRTYERIGEHFAKTREYPWPEVQEFLTDAPTGDVGLDVGCGNGRHATLLARRCDRVVGVDLSRRLLGVASERTGDAVGLVEGDAARLPVRTEGVDLAVYVATIHHLPTRAVRVASLDELARVLAPGGRALVSAWSVAHDRFDRSAGFDTTVDWTLPGGETVGRFYHVYDSEEFRAELADSDLSIRETTVSSGNCYAVVGPGCE